MRVGLEASFLDNEESPFRSQDCRHVHGLSATFQSSGGSEDGVPSGGKGGAECAFPAFRR